MLSMPLYLAQRLSALLMAPLVLVHLVVMIVAIRQGLSSEEILARTRGSAVWALFYTTFVTAAAIHGAIGLRVVLYELRPLQKTTLDALTLLIAAGLLLLGMRAVYAVYSA